MGINIPKNITAPTWGDVKEKPAYLGSTGVPPSAIEGTVDDGAITLTEQSATPTDPTIGTEARIYVKGDLFIIQFNDGGTVRYKYLDLTGVGVTWVHTTTAP